MRAWPGSPGYAHPFLFGCAIGNDERSRDTPCVAVSAVSVLTVASVSSVHSIVV